MRISLSNIHYPAGLCSPSLQQQSTSRDTEVASTAYIHFTLFFKPKRTNLKNRSYVYFDVLLLRGMFDKFCVLVYGFWVN